MNGIVLYMSRLTTPAKERNRSLEQSCVLRRRGENLVAAIFAATIEILAQEGYSGLTFEGVAHLAHTGKASLYRRWHTKVDLVIDALEYELNRCEIPLDFTDLRSGLISKMSSMSESFSGVLGKAMAGCFSAFQREPKLAQAAEAQIINPRKAQLLNSLKLAADAGLIKSEAISPVIANLPIAFVMQSITFEGRPPNRSEIENFIDDVMMPLLVTAN